MKRIFTGILFLSLFSCSGGGSGNASLKSESDSISDPQAVVQPAKELPPGAVPFYSVPVFNDISSLEGVIHTKEGVLVADTFTFDTGTYGLTLTERNFAKEGFTPTDYRGRHIQDGKTLYTVTIGPWTQMLPTKIGRTSAIGWDFFGGKIIKVSYRDGYLLEMNGTEEDLKEYDRIKINNSRSLGRLLIPVEIQVQGKTIKGYVVVDTGFYKNLMFDNTISNKYGINITEGEKAGYSYGETDNHPAFTLIADSIKTGNSVVMNMEVEFAVNENVWDRPDEFIGILGAGFLKNFDVVFDLKNFYLYLKPLNENKSANE